jgi:hypothetical protein
MFDVKITREAKQLFLRLAAEQQLEKPGLMVHRQGPVGEVARAALGAAVWQIERPHPWKARVGEFATFEDPEQDVRQVEGISVWLALIPRLGEAGVEISVRDGELRVEPIPA